MTIGMKPSVSNHLAQKEQKQALATMTTCNSGSVLETGQGTAVNDTEAGQEMAVTGNSEMNIGDAIKSLTFFKHE